MRSRVTTSFLGLLVLAFSVVIVLSPSAWAKNSINNQEKAQSIAHYMMGVMYDLYGLSAFAAYEYEQSIKYRDDVALSHLRLGANYARIGKLDEAAKNLTLASVLNPEDLQARYLLALIYSTQRSFDKAAHEYEMILKSFSENDPQNIEIYVYLGQLYYSQDQLTKAAEQFEKALELDDQNTEMMYLLSSLYEEMDKREMSTIILKNCIKVDDAHAGCLNSLAYIYAEANIQLDQALEYAKKAVDQYPKNGAYLDTLGWLYYRKGMHVEALKTLKQASEVMNDWVIYDHLGDVFLALDRKDDAVKSWKKALEIDPNQANIVDKLNKISPVSAKKSD